MNPTLLSWSGGRPGEPDTRIAFAADGSISSVDVAAGIAGTGEAAGIAGTSEAVVDPRREHLLGGLAVSEIGGRPVEIRHVRIEADEVEAIGECGGLEVRIRHSFDRTWQWRIGLLNAGPRSVDAGRLALALEAGRDGLVHVLAAGALAVVTIHRLDDPSCLALRVTRGELLDDDGIIATPPLRLEPGGRYQLTCSGEWYADPAAVAARRPAWFPESVDLAAEDEPDFMIDHPDAAVEVQELGGCSPSRVVRHDVVEATSRTRVDVAFVAEVQTYAQIAARAAARGFLADAAEAVCLQWAMSRHGIARDEAIELIEDWLVDQSTMTGALHAIVLIRSQDAGAAEDRLARAAEVLAGLPREPGVGLAWLTLWLAHQVRGDQPDVAGPLSRLLPRPGENPALSLSSETNGLGVAAELALLAGPALDRATARRAMRYVELVAQGGPGSVRLPAVPNWQRAIAVVVRALTFIPGREGRADVQAAARRLIAESATDPEGVRTLAWLTLRPLDS